MPATALVQTRIDPEVRDKAAKVLARDGLTISDAARILLTRVANEGAIPMELLASPEQYDAWFRAKVQEALDDPRPDIPSEVVEEYFAKRRAGLKPKAPWDDEA